MQVGLVKVTEDKERRGYRKIEKRERREIYVISFLPVVSFQMNVVRKVEEEGKIKRGCKNIQSFAFSNAAVDTEGGWRDGQLRGVRDMGRGLIMDK